jgi:predicted signal transduction protein with EAL and GGDEF domain
MSELAAVVAAIVFSPTIVNALLLVADALIYFAVLAALFRARYRIGIGAFFCALGVMHFLETYLASVVYVALRIRRDVASHMEADVPLVTVSIGFATCAEDASDYEGLFDSADRRLYLAKSAGRNCVIGETGTDAGAPKLAWAG